MASLLPFCSAAFHKPLDAEVVVNMVGVIGEPSDDKNIKGCDTYICDLCDTYKYDIGSGAIGQTLSTLIQQSETDNKMMHFPNFVTGILSVSNVAEKCTQTRPTFL